MFFLMPGLFVGLTFIDSKGIAMYTFLAVSAVILIIIGTINYLQSHEKFNKSLPSKLRNWEFLPEPMRSLAPYDRLLTSCLCFKKCFANQMSRDSLESTNQIEKGTHNIAYQHTENSTEDINCNATVKIYDIV